MAKKRLTEKQRDPAFLFYDGDAARDVSHMDRLERGCYFDIIQAQRKFRYLTIEQIKKLFGSDFNACWQAIEVILKRKDNTYYIEWLDSAIKNREKYCEDQSEKIQKYWNKKKAKEADAEPVEKAKERISTFIPEYDQEQS